MFPRLRAPLLSLALAAALAAPAQAGPWSIVDTPPPGGFFGVWGFDVYAEQAVAARFTVPAEADHRLLRIGLWLMNNADARQGVVRLSLQTDALDEGGAATQPSGVTLASWSARVDTLGWSPVEQFFGAARAGRPVLQAGRSYWVVARSASPAQLNPVWTVAAEGTMVTTTTGADGSWQPAGEGASLTLQVDAVPLTR